MPDLLQRSGPKLAVGGLVLLNVVLLGALALRGPEPTTSAVPAPGSATSASTRARATPRPASPSPSASPSSSASPSTSPSASGSTPPAASASPSASTSPSVPTGSDRPPSDSSAPTGSDRTRVLAASSDRVAWRAEPSACGKDAVVEVTTDGGRHWKRRDPGIGSVVRLKAFGIRSVFAVGADSRCRPTYAWTTAPSGSWQQSRPLVSDIWFRRPGNLDTVHAPGGTQSRPCGSGLVDVAGLGTYQAAVLCRDGRIRTNAAGRSWRTVATHTGALSLNADDNGFVAAIARSDCAGVVIARFDETGTGLARAQGRCHKSPPAVVGRTAVAIRGDETWVWAADRVQQY